MLFETNIFSIASHELILSIASPVKYPWVITPITLLNPLVIRVSHALMNAFVYMISIIFDQIIFDQFTNKKVKWIKSTFSLL